MEMGGRKVGLHLAMWKPLHSYEFLQSKSQKTSPVVEVYEMWVGFMLTKTNTHCVFGCILYATTM
jgi:hypothetical protein